ncbi:hypothetical protein Btru_002282 [Bulinus truncatus]|nr:hypothetical protein Btru_002282 [Bulinus truncatus]
MGPTVYECPSNTYHGSDGVRRYQCIRCQNGDVSTLSSVTCHCADSESSLTTLKWRFGLFHVELGLVQLPFKVVLIVVYKWNTGSMGTQEFVWVTHRETWEV